MDSEEEYYDDEYFQDDEEENDWDIWLEKTQHMLRYCLKKPIPADQLASKIHQTSDNMNINNIYQFIDFNREFQRVLEQPTYTTEDRKQRIRSINNLSRAFAESVIPAVQVRDSSH